jgi:lipid-A-disaccharide synthase
LAHEVLQWLTNPAAVAAVQQRFAALHDTLRRDTPALATHAIEKVLAR